MFALFFNFGKSVSSQEYRDKRHQTYAENLYKCGTELVATSFVFMLLLFLFFIQSSYGYGDLFSETWAAFTDYEIIHLKSFDSKRVWKCFLTNFLCMASKRVRTSTVVMLNNASLTLVTN